MTERNLAMIIGPNILHKEIKVSTLSPYTYHRHLSLDWVLLVCSCWEGVFVRNPLGNSTTFHCPAQVNTQWSNVVIRYLLSYLVSGHSVAFQLACG